jgi:cell division cycle 2-like protein
MEYMEHEMKELLKMVRFSEKQVKRLMKDLLLGIECIHQKNVVHRDLKTSNLLYSNNGILKICDFGLARKISQAPMTQ